MMRIHRVDGTKHEVSLTARIDSVEELAAYRQGGILPQVYREFIAQI
jgi:aconitase A